MAEFKTAFVAIILFFCLFQNGGAQQYEDSLSESPLGDWQPRRSRLRSKPATRSVVVPSPEDLPNYSSPDVTTRTRQRTRGRNTPDPLADPRYYGFDTPESQQQGFPQDPTFRPDVPRRRKDDIKGVQQRTNIKTLEDSLNTERYQKKVERPQNIRRNGFVDQTEANRPTEFGRNDDLGVESPSRRFQRTRGRGAAERRIGTADDEPATASPPAPRSRGTFRSRATFQDVQIASNAAETPKRGRTRAFTSRYQNVETTEATAPYAPENAVRTSFPAQPIRQSPDQQFQLVQQFTPSDQPPQAGFEPILTSVQPQRTDAHQPNGRSEALFPNLSTQQFSTDPTQFVRLNNEVAPTVQQFSSTLGQQFIQGNRQSSVQNPPGAHLGEPSPDVLPQRIPDARLGPSQADGEPIQPDQRISRRIDGNEVERTPQLVPLEPSKGRKNFRSRARAPSAFASTPVLEIETESAPKSYDAQQGRSRGRQGSFRSRTRAYASNDEATTPAASPPPRSRTTAQARQNAENVQPKSVAFRGRSRSQAVDTKPSLEAKERIFTEELPGAEFEDQASHTQVKSPSRPAKPFRGTVTAKITETQSEEDAEATENYPKEFLEKLKSSKGFVPPPKRTRPNPRTTIEQTFTPTVYNVGTTRLKRKQFTTENYSRGDSDTSETTNRESQNREETQPPENDRNAGRPTANQTRERYSQRFYRKLASKSTATRGTPTPQTTAEPKKPDEAPRSRLPARKNFRSFSASTTSATTEFELSTTEQPAPGEERRRFVPKNKVTLEERKLRIARLKEKLRQNATEGELKTAESQESFVVKESLVVQANTHPGSREVHLPEGPKHAVEAKSSASSHAKETKGGRQRGEAKFRDVEGTSNKYDLITLGSEETFQAVVPGGNRSSASTTTTTPGTTTGEAVTAAPKAASTTSKPQAATQVPPSTTTKPDFAVLNVTLFPSTRHRFSARINSSANIVLPPDVELITTTAPSTALNAPETTTSLGRQPDFTFSVNKLFNSSLATTTSASVARAATARNSSGTALSTPSTQSISPGTTTQKTSTTTKRSSSKKKSSGRKKSKKTKSKSSGNGTTTQRPPTPKAKSTAKTTPTPAAATVRTAPVNSTGNASSSNSTGVRPLSLAFSDIENIFNETMKVVNSNPMAGPLPGVVPRSELNALTPETLLNGTTTEDAAEGTTARAEAATSSNTNSVDNSTNQVETPERLTSEVECSNGTCTKSKSQTVHFNEGGSGGARAPLPYVRRDGTTKSPETLRKIFVYGIFPNNTVQRKPFPGDGGEERFSSGRHDAGRYSGPVRPTTRVPQHTVGDYYVFGVYPNNSVVKRRGWKTFDYEKYHSPYVIFGIYPNNTIIKKFPNGTTIDDEVTVSDNEIRKTAPDGYIYRGCSCADGAHRHPVTPAVQTTEGTTRRTTTSTTTATTEAPATSEGSVTETPEKPDESETEEPERNAKDDAENIDFQAESLPQAEVSEENPTTTETGLAEDEGEEGGEDEEEEGEKESEGTTESTLGESTTSSQFNEGAETTTQSPQRSLDEAEQADMVSTEGAQEETTTRAPETGGPEGLENAEEADDASTPRSLEESTNSLEREETQTAKGSGTLTEAEEADAKDTVESSNAGSLADAEQVDDAKIAGEGTEESVKDSTTERSENIQEKVEGSDSKDNVTEISENNEENLDLSEGTTAKAYYAVSNETVPETTEGNSGSGTTEASNYLAEGTTEESERLVENTTEEGTTKSSDNESIRESTERISESEETTTESSESLTERTTEVSYHKTTIKGEGLTTEAVTESATRRAESLEERTTEEAFYDRTTESGEYSQESTTEENGSRGGLESPEESSSEGNEEYRDYSTEGNENLSESTTEQNGSRGGLESPEESSTERSEEYRDSTPASNENLSESSTEENGFEGEVESLEDRTTETGENIVDETSERSESSAESTTEGNSYGDSAEYSDERTTEGSWYDSQETTEGSESLQESTTDRSSESRESGGSGEDGTTESDEYYNYESEQLSEERTTEAESTSEEPETSFAYSDEEARRPEPARTTENAAASTTEKPSPEENLIIDLNSDLEPATSTEPSLAAEEDIRELNQLKELAAKDAATTEGARDASTETPRETTLLPDARPPATDSARLEDRFDGYTYEKPTGKSFGLEDAPATETTEPDGGEDSSTPNYDFDVRELGNLISRLTTGAFGDAASTDPTTEGPAAEATTDALLNALLPLSLDHLQASADGNQVKKRHRRALDDLDEPSSLTNLAYRALSSSETTSTPIPVLTTTMTTTTTTTRATKPPATASAPRARPKKLRNLSKTSVTAYKNLTNLTSTPLPDEVFIVTPVASTRAHPDADYSRRGKVKFVTLTPGVVVTTNVHDENDILTMSSQHVQKVTKAPAKIPENFLSTVFGEIEEKASSPIPDILKNVENDLHGDGLSASLARRIITLALEKAMTSTTPPITPQPITATTIPAALDHVVTTPRPQSTASYIQKIPEAIISTTSTTKKPTTTKKPITTTKKPTTTSKRPKPITTTTTTTTTRKPFTSSTTRRPRISSTTTTTESPQTVLITPKKAAEQQVIRNPAAAETSPEFLASTLSPQINVESAPLDLAPLNVLFSNEKPAPTTTTPASQRITEDLNVLLSGLWEEQASANAKPPETSNLVEPKRKPTKSKSALSKQASASLSESDLRILEAILQQQGDGGANQDLEQIVQNQIRLAEEVRKASRNLKKKQRTTTTTTTERPGPLGLGFLLNLFGAGSRANGLFPNEQRNARRPRPLAAPYVGLGNGTNAIPDPFGEPDEGSTTGDRSARGELVSAAIDVTKAVSKFMGTVLTHLTLPESLNSGRPRRSAVQARAPPSPSRTSSGASGGSWASAGPKAPGRRLRLVAKSMPQTVPSTGYGSPYCDYSAFTTDFDLSLLPASPESEVPLSPKNLSPYSYLCPSPPPMFPANLEDGILCDGLGFVDVKGKVESEAKQEFEDEPLHTPLKKSPSAGFFDDKLNFKEKDEKFEYYGKKEEKVSSRPLIPATVQATAAPYYALPIKREPGFGADYARSEFQANPPSPYAIKAEKTIDLREVLEETQFLQSPVKYEAEDKRYATLRSLLKTPAGAEGAKQEEGKPDHQLLRSVLRDTSFQKKFNLRPFDLPQAQNFGADQKEAKMEGEGPRAQQKPGDGNEMVEELTSEKIEPVFSLAIEQIKRDVDNTCNILGISSDPTQWTEEDVKAWLLWTVRQFSLPMINTDCFGMDGAALCRLTEEEFQQRAPQSSSTLHAHLEIWKAASSCGECSTTPAQDLGAVQWSPTMHSSGSSTGGDLSEDDDEEMEFSTGSPESKAGPSRAGEPTTSAGKARGASGSHIHLWQFLKELLASPQAHGSCIRWLDRQKGVFKIEDSVRVARLWGKRKNRPAMNYDKLSRSIRQYYKKGIMKKTERSQRLVYQFCHPYCL